MNDANSINQIGQAMINNWKENRAQEQAAAAFNRETNTTNANILNQVDQFNANMQAQRANIAAQLRYNLEKDKVAARDAYYAGLLGNMGSALKGGYEAWRENQRRNQIGILGASGVFGETNDLLNRYYGFDKYDTTTGLVKSGPNQGKYRLVGSDGKVRYVAPAEYDAFVANAKRAKGGKLNKKNKRKGYTF